MNDFISWATIVGGFSGFLSFIYVVYEKLNSGPKVVSEVTSATVYEREPSQSDQWYNYDFTIEIEIGNIGSKLTSILKPKLEIPEVGSRFKLYFRDDTNNPIRLSRKPSIALEAGFADSHSFHCNYRCETKLEVASFTGKLELKQIKGNLTQHNFKFENWKKNE